MTATNVFDPVQFSIEECQFLLTTLGQPPIVALRGKPLNVNTNAVRPILERVYELTELEAHTGVGWVGVPALQEKLEAYLAQHAKWEDDKRRGAPRWPSMHAYDGKGRPHRQGVGSDSGQVRTYFDAAGQRVPFAIELVPTGQAEWHPEWAKADEASEGLKVDRDNRRIECLICGHTEAFNPDSRGSYNAARGRISKHLRSATIEVERHREVHMTEFGSAA